ncbi:MAG TPA: hypothetical protein VMT83_01085 [Burkholderiaceae bacterium]|nr:hypothetical protein [Burkholderiaceae bacterium]
MANRRALRRAGAALLAGALSLAAAPARAAGCDCFSPEAQLKTAQEAMQQARVVALGRIVAVAPDGQATVLVLESFKGTAAGATIGMAPADPARCRDATAPAVDEVALVLAFGDTVSGCDKYPSGHYMVEWFRQIAVKARAARSD